VTASGLVYSRVTRTFNGTVTITNGGGTAIDGPFQIVFLYPPVNVQLVNALGVVDGSPYITVPAVANLAPRQSATVNVQFNNPSNAKIQLIPIVYSGCFN